MSKLDCLLLILDTSKEIRLDCLPLISCKNSYNVSEWKKFRCRWSLFLASRLGIFNLKIGKNHRFLALGMVPFIGTSYIREKNTVRIRFNLIVIDVHKELSSLGIKNSNRKYKLSTSLFISWINRWGRILIRISIHR